MGSVMSNDDIVFFLENDIFEIFTWLKMLKNASRLRQHRGIRN